MCNLLQTAKIPWLKVDSGLDINKVFHTYVEMSWRPYYRKREIPQNDTEERKGVSCPKIRDYAMLHAAMARGRRRARKLIPGAESRSGRDSLLHSTADCMRAQNHERVCCVCGESPEIIHVPVLHSGVWCAAHCPVCGPADHTDAPVSRE